MVAKERQTLSRRRNEAKRSQCATALARQKRRNVLKCATLVTRRITKQSQRRERKVRTGIDRSPIRSPQALDRRRRATEALGHLARRAFCLGDFFLLRFGEAELPLLSHRRPPGNARPDGRRRHTQFRRQCRCLRSFRSLGHAVCSRLEKIPSHVPSMITGFHTVGMQKAMRCR